MGHCVPLMVWVSEGFMYLLFGGGGEEVSVHGGA